MFRQDDFLPYLVFSILLHISILYLASYNKKNHVYLTSPIEVTFYSSSRQTSNQSISEPSSGYNQKTSRQLSGQPASETSAGHDVETTASQTKEDIVIKKDNQKKSTKEKSKIQTKKATAQSVKQIARNQTGTGKGSSSSGNGSSVETFRSAGNGSSVETSRPAGSLLSSTGTGSLYGNPSFDNQNFKYSYYTDQIRRKTRSNLRWAEDYGDNLRAVVYFRINRDGTVHNNISIKESSGNSEFDEDALGTISRAAPFPELPEGYNEESLGVFFEFKWFRNRPLNN
ncbi:hypothetical protein AGMMS49990_09520 [Endomicrobiia bacterium]|nr:hypothetical protein AGMMS49990_09520 [Endomicrobiia bacterium]